MAESVNWDAVCRHLATIDFPSMRHMAPASEHPERYDGIRTMLSDLNRLATEDGCIAAAWALDAIPTLAYRDADAGIERTWHEFYASREEGAL